jgi:hypothetical protein
VKLRSRATASSSRRAKPWIEPGEEAHVRVRVGRQVVGREQVELRVLGVHGADLVRQPDHGRDRAPRAPVGEPAREVDAEQHEGERHQPEPEREPVHLLLREHQPEPALGAVADVHEVVVTVGVAHAVVARRQHRELGGDAVVGARGGTGRAEQPAHVVRVGQAEVRLLGAPLPVVLGLLDERALDQHVAQHHLGPVHAEQRGERDHDHLEDERDPELAAQAARARLLVERARAAGDRVQGAGQGRAHRAPI